MRITQVLNSHADKITKHQGFSLLELLVVLSIIGLAVTAGVPNFNAMLERHRAEAVQQNTARLITRARQFAVAHARSVTLCGSVSGEACDGDWNDGLLVAAHYEDGRDEMDVLEYQQLVDNGALLRWNRNSQRLRFNAQGITYSHNGSFIYCSSQRDPRFARRIVVAKTGRVRTPGLEAERALCS